MRPYAATLALVKRLLYGDELGDLGDIHYAIGIDVGTTLVTKLGAYGDRDRICLGSAFESAQDLEDMVAGASEIAASSAVHATLPESVQIPLHEALVRLRRQRPYARQTFKGAQDD